jgi:SAM-dependent methyltransferase
MINMPSRAFREEIPVSLRRLHEIEVRSPVILLDWVARHLSEKSNVHEVMDVLSDGLWWLKKATTPAEWAATLELAYSHPVRQYVHQDAFTHRSYVKPRGYAGDACLIDMMYYDLGVADLNGTSPLGLAIFERNKNTPAPMAVRERRDFMAAIIDETVDELGAAHILSVACGHLREGRISKAVRDQKCGRFVALDQDAMSIEVVRTEFGDKGVEVTAERIKGILSGRFEPNQFDFIYASGLYDYLQQRLAEALTQALFQLLRPSGRLIVGNFVPDIYDVGYMEAYMGWNLMLRDPAQLLALSRSIPDSEVSLRRTYSRRSADIAYLELRKRSGKVFSL